MKESVNAQEAKTHFSRLLARVNQGEEIIIAKAGRPVARIVPYAPIPAKRVPGTAKGKIQIGKNFEDPLPKNLMKFFES
jgi:prevent-host-death family protein